MNRTLGLACNIYYHVKFIIMYVTIVLQAQQLSNITYDHLVHCTPADIDAMSAGN